jgi:sensor histidine kinase YesM
VKQKWYIHKASFRILFPVLAGIFLYLAMLLVFGNLDDLAGSFTGREALFIVALTYISHEWAILFLGRKASINAFAGREPLPKILYFTVLILSNALITSGIILFYFMVVLDYFYFLTELITINILLALFQFMVHLYYLSMLNIRRSHELSMDREAMQEERLQTELESFKSEMNPDLLLDCLENLLTLIHTDTDKSENYIQSLSNQYRYLLEHRKKELVDLGTEINAARELVYLLNGGGQVKINLKEDVKNKERMIIPGTLNHILYQVENSMILSPANPLEIELFQQEDGVLRIRHANRPRLKAVKKAGMDKLNRSYRHFTGRVIETTEEDSRILWVIPGLPEILEATNQSS